MSQTLTPPPASRAKFDGTNSPISASWVIGILLLAFGGVTTYAVRLHDQQFQPVAELQVKVAALEKASAERDVEDARRWAEVKAWMEANQREIGRATKLLSRLAARQGIEVAE